MKNYENYLKEQELLTAQLDTEEKRRDEQYDGWDTEYEIVEREEKRFFRREIINTWLHFTVRLNMEKLSLDELKYFVRSDEIDTYGRSMSLYNVTAVTLKKTV